MRLLGWIVLVPLALVAVVFAVANRGPVRVSLDPLPVAFETPLYLIVFAALFAGIVFGGIAARLAAWRSGAARAKIPARDNAATRAALDASPERPGVLPLPPVA